MANYLFVDNSNVWIEGMHVSAVETGMALDILDAQEHRICDQGWRFDFGRLHEFAGGAGTGKAYLYGSRPPPNDSLWETARAKGFEVVVFDRIRGKEKKLDVTIARDMVKHSYEAAKPGQDEFTLVAGDRDYVPIIEDLVERGFVVDVVFWDHAAGELKAACSKFISLNPYLEYLALRKSSI